MRVLIRNISRVEDEQVVLECVKMTREFEDIRDFAQMKGSHITGFIDDTAYQLKLSDILYFEAVGEKVFAYTRNELYNVKFRLYEIEKRYQDSMFVRCSKSILVNISHIDAFRPAPDTRLIARMTNGEEVMVSRLYAKTMKERIAEG